MFQSLSLTVYYLLSIMNTSLFISFNFICNKLISVNEFKFNF